MQKNLNTEKIAFKVVQIKFLSMHITKQKLSFDIYGKKCTKYLHGLWSLLNIPMIFGIKEKSIILTMQCIFGYCYKYTPATLDWFCGPGSQIWLSVPNTCTWLWSQSVPLHNDILIIKDADASSFPHSQQIHAFWTFPACYVWMLWLSLMKCIKHLPHSPVVIWYSQLVTCPWL